nr:MAG TPA_asm: hypothetical protein [Caudoviricetes sp.]
MACWWRWSGTACLTRICLFQLSISTIPLRYSRTSRLRLKLVAHHSYLQHQRNHNRKSQNSHQLSWKKCSQKKKVSSCRRMILRHERRVAPVIATVTATGASNV